MLRFNKYRGKNALKFDKTLYAEEKKRTSLIKKEPLPDEKSQLVVSVLVRRHAKFTGSQPATREQLGTAFWHGYVYMYGGAGQRAYSDLKRLSPEKCDWINIGEVQNQKKFDSFLMKTPEGRFGHSMNVYKDFLVMFGGSGLFNMEIKKRETYDEIVMYDLTRDRWIDPLIHRDDPTLTESIIE